MVLEATGGLERVATAALATAGLPGVVVNPRQARDVAPATGQLATTEALDARALLGRRQPLIGMRTAAQHRLVGTSGRLIQDSEAHIA